MPNTFYEPMPRSPATELADDIDNLETSIPVLDTNVFPAAPNLATIGQGMVTTVVESGTATSGAAAELADTTKTWGANAWAGMVLRIVAGTGTGQRRTIVSNTATAITVTPTWGTIPDITSDYDIVSSESSPISETVVYLGKATGALTGVIRGYEPAFSARAWPGGTVIARAFAAQDLRAVQNRAVIAEGDITALEILTSTHTTEISDLGALVAWYRERNIWGAA